jgi:hypothetical protein
VQVFHRTVPFPGEDIRQHAEGKIDAGIQFFLFGARRATQDKIGDHAGDAWVANAEPQTVEIIVVPQLRDDVTQPVVTSMAAAQFELGNTWREIEFVVGHQYGFRRNPEKTGKRRNGLAASVHIGGGNQQTNILTLMAESTGQAKILTVCNEVNPVRGRETLNKKGPCVMPGLFVFGAWISQANDQFYGGHDKGPSMELWITSPLTAAAKTDKKAGLHE